MHHSHGIVGDGGHYHSVAVAEGEHANAQEKSSADVVRDGSS